MKRNSIRHGTPKLPEAAHKWSYSEWQQQIDRLSPDAESEVTAGTPDDWARGNG